MVVSSFALVIGIVRLVCDVFAVSVDLVVVRIFVVATGVVDVVTVAISTVMVVGLVNVVVTGMAVFVIAFPWPVEIINGCDV